MTLLGHTHLPIQVVAPLWDYSKSPSSPIARPSSMSCPGSRTPLGIARPPLDRSLCTRSFSFLLWDCASGAPDSFGCNRFKDPKVHSGSLK